ncbi:IPP transferase-domain-containing protein [Russula aff. rugulosa BPL654]|nr:IPP transferase-domain-containing protein [Russula aff. rugulosa BPL654]
MQWRVKIKTTRCGVVVEAGVETATAVHVHPCTRRIVLGAPAIFGCGHLQQMARMIPARDHGARLPPAQLLLWDPMVVFVLVVVASPQIGFLPFHVPQMAFRPVIAICGTTGVGKSKLAIELALKLSEKSDHHGWKGGVVVNADAMQTYKGFNTITNKIPLGERAGVDHVLMDFKEPTEQYVVGQWIHDATRAISDAHGSKKVPIVVGGTAYWIQHLVFPGRLAVEPEQISRPSLPSADSKPPSDGLSSALSQLFDALPETPPSAVDDPAAALAFGRKVSEILQEQSAVTLRPRYDTLFLWLYAEPTELKRRLDIRADEMLHNGLLEEVCELSRIQGSPNKASLDIMAPSSPAPDFTHGVFQSIGFRGFHQYLTDPSPSEMTYQAAVQNLKTANHQYAKRQVSWIRNKLLPAIRASKSSEGTEGVDMYLLDATEPQQWTSEVRDAATGLMEGQVPRGDTLSNPLTLSSTAQRMLSVPIKATDPTAVLLARRKILCPVCTVDEALPVMIEEGSEWEAHARTKVHKRLAAKSTESLRKGHVHNLPAQGKGERTRGDLIGSSGSADDPPIPFDGLFGT